MAGQRVQERTIALGPLGDFDYALILPGGVGQVQPQGSDVQDIAGPVGPLDNANPVAGKFLIQAQVPGLDGSADAVEIDVVQGKPARWRVISTKVGLRT